MSGDDACLVVWNLKTGENVQDIWCTFNGPVSCIAWIASDKQNEEDVLVFGCADGSLHVYERMDHNVSTMASLPVPVYTSTILVSFCVHFSH